MTRQAPPGCCSSTHTRTPPRWRASPDGEAADLEIALLLGLDAPTPPGRCADLPAIEPDALVMLGQRDEAYRDALAVASLADRVPTGPGRAGARTGR